MNVVFDNSQEFAVELVETEVNTALETELEMAVDFTEDAGLTCDFDTGGDFDVNFGTGTVSGDYDGPYRVTPSELRQTLSTTGKVLGQNVIVDPIPSNYGLITWNGSVIRVS